MDKFVLSLIDMYALNRYHLAPVVALRPLNP